MQASVKKAIKSIIAKTRMQLKHDNKPVELNKYSSQLQLDLRAEIIREIERVEAMLEDEITFESRLKERCSKRSHDYKKSMPLRFLPDSPANQFYWELVTAVFKPENTQKMLEIMLPDLKYQFDILLTQDGDGVEIVRRPLQTNLQVDYTDLPHYSITADALLDNRQLKKLSSVQQQTIQEKISDSYPELRQGRYENTVLREMLTGRMAIINKPASPRVALQRLHKAYIKGSSNNTYNGFAPESTLVAISEFSDFLASLTEENRTQLRGLKNYNNRTLGSILDKEIYSGECAQATSKLLSSILEANQDSHNILNMNLVDHERIQEEVLELQSCVLPDMFVNRLPVIGKLSAKEVVDIFAEMPAVLYSSYIRFYRHLSFLPVLNLINYETMSNEQLHAFVDAIAQHCPPQRESKEFIAWLSNINNPSLFKVYINRCSESELPALIKRFTGAKEFQLLLERGSPEIRLSLLVDPEHEHKWQVMAAYLNKDLLQGANVDDLRSRTSKLITLFNNYVITHRKRLIKFAREVAQSGVIPSKLSHPDCDWLMDIQDLSVLLALVSNIEKNTVNQFFLTPDSDGRTVFHQCKSVDVISHFLGLLLPAERESMLTARDKFGVCPLNIRLLPNEVLAEMVKAIPEKNRFNIFTAELPRGGSFMCQEADDPERLRILLESLPHEIRLKSVLLSYQIQEYQRNITSVFNRAVSASNPAALQALLNSLPRGVRLMTLIGNSADKRDDYVLRCLGGLIKRINAAISCLNDSEADDLLMMKIELTGDRLLDTVLWKGNHALHDMEMLVSRLTSHRLQQSFKVENITLMRRFVDFYTELVPSILKRLPDTQRRKLIEMNLGILFNQHNDNVIVNVIETLSKVDQLQVIPHALYLCLSKPESFKKLLQMVDPEKCLAVLQQSVPQRLGNSLFIIREATGDTDRLTTVLESIPQKFRLAVLLTTVRDSETVIQSRLNASHESVDIEIERWVEQLDDEQICEFLQLHCGSQTLSQLYINECVNKINSKADYLRPYNMVSFLQEKYRPPKTRKSFMQDMLPVMVYLNYEDQRVRGSQFCWGLFQTTAAGELLAKLKQCKTVDEFKLTMMTEIDDPNSHFSLKLACALINPQPKDTSTAIPRLKKLWKMENVIKRLDSNNVVNN